MTSDIQSITDLLDAYYDGLYRCDTDLLQQVFHPKAHYNTVSSGDLLHMDMETYFSLLKERTSPEARGDKRFLEVDTIELAGPAAASVRLRCHMLDYAYSDLLTLLKIDDRWQIISKAFHVEPLTK